MTGSLQGWHPLARSAWTLCCAATRNNTLCRRQQSGRWTRCWTDVSAALPDDPLLRRARLPVVWWAGSRWAGRAGPCAGAQTVVSSNQAAADTMEVVTGCLPVVRGSAALTRPPWAIARCAAALEAATAEHSGVAGVGRAAVAAKRAGRSAVYVRLVPTRVTAQPRGT